MHLHNPLETSISIEQSTVDFEYKNLLINSYKGLEKYDSANCPANLQSVLDIDGMSGSYYRLLINTIIKSILTPRYLEIGSWKGSTACAAMSNNKCKVVCIDNWSLFDGPKEDFISNTNNHLSSDIQFTFLEKDFRTVDYNQLGKFNVYLFDGPHSKQDHYDGVVIPQSALDDTYILVVDDWNWLDVRTGTMEALNGLGSTVLESITIKTTQNNNHAPDPYRQHSRWHNGYFIAIVSK